MRITLEIPGITQVVGLLCTLNRKVDKMAGEVQSLIDKVGELEAGSDEMRAQIDATVVALRSLEDTINSNLGQGPVLAEITLRLEAVRAALAGKGAELAAETEEALTPDNPPPTP